MYIRVTGVGRTKIRVDEFYKRTHAAAAKRLKRITDEIVIDAKRLVAVDTGLLQSSIEIKSFDADALQAAVGTSVRYAKYQERGTWKMAAHPFLAPALAIAKAKLHQF